jgi:hypothetical protein
MIKMGPITGATNTKAGAKTSAAETGVSSKNIDSFLNDLMSPSPNSKTQISDVEGDVSLYQSVAPADIYTANTLVSVLRSPITQAYVKKIENPADYHRLLVADLLIGQAQDGKKKQIEDIIVSTQDSASLEANLVKAAELFRAGMSPEEKEKELATLHTTLKEGYIRGNRSSIEQRLKRDFNNDSEMRKQAGKRANRARGIIAVVLVAAIAVFGYLGVQSYQKQVDLQRNFGTYIEQTYHITLPETFYQFNLGGK